MRYSEPQLSSELLDQPLFSGTPLKVFICSTARSGSYLLCRYMVNAGLGVPHEYFNPIIMRQIAPRLGLEQVSQLKWRPRSPWNDFFFGKTARGTEMSFLGDYLRALVPRRCQSGVFAAKIHFDHYLKVLDNQTGCELLNGGLFIHLYREDLLAQAVSTHFANLTGRWGIDDTVTTVPASHPNFFDVELINRHVEQIAEQNRGWRVFFGRNGLSILSMSYERLCADPFGFVVLIARRLGLDPDTLRQDYAEPTSSPASDADLLHKRDVTRHYLARVGKIHAFQR